jgi:hypothetical protein
MSRLLVLICLISAAWAAVLFLRPDPWIKAEDKAQADAELLVGLIARPDRIGWRLTEDLSLTRAMLWDLGGIRRYPDPNGFTPLLYEFTEDETRLLVKKQSDLTAPIWEQFDTSGTELLHCRKIPAVCQVYDRLVLEQMLGVREGALSAPHFGFGWLIAFIATAVASCGVAICLRKGSEDRQEAFSLSRQRHSAIRGTLEVPLSPRDLKLLEFLDAKDGAVATKDELYDAGWGRDFMPNSRALDQHIINLRRKLDPDKSRPVLIETVHGVGYRLLR